MEDAVWEALSEGLYEVSPLVEVSIRCALSQELLSSLLNSSKNWRKVVPWSGPTAVWPTSTATACSQ